MKCDCGVVSLDESHLNWCCLLQDDSVWDFSPKPTLKEMNDRADRLYWKPQRKNAEHRIRATEREQAEALAKRFPNNLQTSPTYSNSWNKLLTDAQRINAEIKKRTQ